MAGDVGGELHHFERLALFVENRIVAGLNPDFLAAFADALVFGGLELPVVQIAPELLVFGALAIGGFDEHAVMAAFDFVQCVAQHRQEVLIGVQDGARQVKFNDGLGFVDGGKLAAKFHQFGLVIGGAVGLAVVAVLAVDASVSQLVW